MTGLVAVLVEGLVLVTGLSAPASAGGTRLPTGPVPEPEVEPEPEVVRDPPPLVVAPLVVDVAFEVPPAPAVELAVPGAGAEAAGAD